jgi:nifR3 family TIM-barrel protein
MSDRLLFHSVNIGSLSVAGNVWIAPVAGFSTPEFRALALEMGASLGFTELVSAEAVWRNPQHYINEQGEAVNPLVTRAAGEALFAVQLFGGQPESLYKAAKLLAPLKPALVDINSGCPVPKVVKTGGGAGMMRDIPRLADTVAAVKTACDEALGGIPVTIKIRSGWDDAHINFLEAAEAAVQAGASLVTLHPRTRAQAYAGRSNWNYIKELVDARLAEPDGSTPVPICASGDLYTPEDAQAVMEETGCSAVMFARGAMGNPFIFRQIRDFLTTGAYTSVTAEEKKAAAIRELEAAAKIRGEARACREMRPVVCAYLKGVPEGAQLRGKIVHAETVEEYRRILYT